MVGKADFDVMRLESSAQPFTTDFTLLSPRSPCLPTNKGGTATRVSVSESLVYLGCFSTGSHSGYYENLLASIGFSLLLHISPAYWHTWIENRIYQLLLIRNIC